MRVEHYYHALRDELSCTQPFAVSPNGYAMRSELLIGENTGKSAG